MKIVKLIFCFILCSTLAFAQTNLTEYQYWYNDDFLNQQTVLIAPASQHQWNASLDVSGLPEGVNVVNIRYKDENGLFSSTLSKIFYKNTEVVINDKKLVAYEIWYNNDYDSRQVTTIVPATQHTIVSDLNVSGLPDGVNVLNIRYKDENGIYSSTLSKIFYKDNDLQRVDKKLIAYEFWFNNDYRNRQFTEITPADQHLLVRNIDVSDLSEGINVFNIRYLDESGIFSSTFSKIFYKSGNQVINNTISAIKYWLDDDHINAKYIALETPVKQHVITDNLDMQRIAKGNHTLHYQFKDANGVWSVVNSETFVKESLPIADFSYTTNSYCDSTEVNFEDKSIDGDKYEWDFGDGTTDSSPEPSHIYYDPGTYLVSMTVTDLTTLEDSTVTASIVVKGNTSSEITRSVCGSFISPSNLYTYFESGMYYDTLSNSLGCDSIITINLTVLQPASGTDIVSSCGPYTWIDGITYTENNNSATYTYVGGASNGCDSILTLNLTVLLPADGTDVISSCGPYTWIDGNTYTESNNSVTYTYVGGASNGCDSTVTLNLTVLQPASGTDVISSCGPYTWIDGNTYTESNNSATYTYMGGASNGCDSVVSLNLTINTIDRTVTQTGNTLSANASDALYQWLNCSSDYQPVEDATSQSFIPDIDGSYAVKITQNGCIDTTDCYVINITGLTENSFDKEINAYPNPTNRNIQIDLGETHSEAIAEVRDAYGRLIKQFRFINKQILNVDIDKPDGIYFITILSKNSKAVIKVIKN